MKLLFSSPSGPEVGLLKSLLDEAGIQSELRNESISSNFPGAPFQSEIWVIKEVDYEEACGVRDAWRETIVPDDCPSHPMGKHRPTRGSVVFCGLASLVALVFAVRSGGQLGQTGDMRDAVKIAFLILVSATFLWGAVAQWRDIRGRR